MFANRSDRLDGMAQLLPRGRVVLDDLSYVVGLVDCCWFVMLKIIVVIYVVLIVLLCDMIFPIFLLEWHDFFLAADLVALEVVHVIQTLSFLNTLV